MPETQRPSSETPRRPMVPTGTSLPRLVRHLRDGERFWFHAQLLGDGGGARLVTGR